MRILAVSYMLPPMLYPQAIQMGRLLAYTSGDIAVVSGRSPIETGLDCYTELDRKFRFHLDVPHPLALSGVPFILAKRFLPFYGSIPDEYRGWVPLAYNATMAKIAETGFRPDVLVTFGEPMSDHLLGLRLKRSLNVPWVAHFSDPWADHPFRRWNVFANIINRRLEAETIKAADRVIFTSQETIDLVMAKYPKDWRHKTDVLPHSFDTRLFPARTSAHSGIVVRHIGNFYGKRTPYPLFRALRTVFEHSPALLDGVRFEFIGRLPTGSRWHPSYRALPEGLVAVRDTVAYSESLRLMKDSDLLLAVDAPADLSVFLLSKLVDYIGSETPIMGIVPPGSSAVLLRRLGAHIANPRRPDEIAATLKKALEDIRSRRSSPPTESWGAPDVRAEYLPETMATAFEAILRKAVK